MASKSIRYERVDRKPSALPDCNVGGRHLGFTDSELGVVSIWLPSYNRSKPLTTRIFRYHPGLIRPHAEIQVEIVVVGDDRPMPRFLGSETVEICSDVLNDSSTPGEVAALGRLRLPPLLSGNACPFAPFTAVAGSSQTTPRS